MHLASARVSVSVRTRLLVRLAAFASVVPGTLARTAPILPLAGSLANAAGTLSAAWYAHGPFSRSVEANQRPEPRIHHSLPLRRMVSAVLVTRCTPGHASASSGLPEIDTRTVGRMAM